MPLAGDSVIISNGSTVTLDTDTKRLASLQVDAGGALAADPAEKNSNNIFLAGNFANNGTVDLTTSNFQNIIYLAGNNVTSTLSGSGIWLLDTIDLSGFGSNKCTGTCKTELSGSPNLQFYDATPFAGQTATNTVNALGNATATITLALAGNQTIVTTGVTYPNLVLSGSGAKNPDNAMTVGGSFIIGSGTTFNAGTFTHSIAGNFTNNGTFVASTSTITLNGGAPQVMGGTIATAFNNLIINNAAGVTLSRGMTAGGVLTLTNGIVTTGVNVPEVVSNCATGVVRTGGWVVGNLSLHYPTNAGTTTCIFPIGDAANYTPVAVAMTNVTSSLANSILTARTDPGDHPDTVALLSGIDPGRSVNRTWTVTQGALLAFATHNATFTFVNSDVDSGANTANFIIAWKSGGVWTYPAMGAKNSNDTTATSMSGFGVFAIGERAVPSITVVKTVSTFSDPYNNTTNPKSIPGAVMLYTATVINSGPAPADANTLALTDPVPANTLMCVSVLCNNPPIVFTCSAAPACGLTSAYATAVTYTNRAGGVGPYDYIPVPDADGYDAAVTGFSIRPAGQFNGVGGPPYSQFTVQFKVKVK